MKILGIILLTLFWFFPAGPNLAFAQSASLTATVKPNPLKVELSAPPTAIVGQWFDIRADISNLGQDSITKTTATLNTPTEVVARGKSKKLGNLGPQETKIVTWRAKANSSGEFVILVEVEGNLDGEKISASDSTVITATSSLGFLIRRLIFGS